MKLLLHEAKRPLERKITCIKIFLLDLFFNIITIKDILLILIELSPPHETNLILFCNEQKELI